MREQLPPATSAEGAVNAPPGYRPGPDAPLGSWENPIPLPRGATSGAIGLLRLGIDSGEQVLCTHSQSASKFLKGEHGDASPTRFHAGQSANTAATRLEGQVLLAEAQVLARPANVGPQALVRRTHLLTQAGLVSLMVAIGHRVIVAHPALGGSAGERGRPPAALRDLTAAAPAATGMGQIWSGEGCAEPVREG